MKKPSERMLSINERMSGKQPVKKIITEGATPKNSIYGAVTDVVLPHLLETLKKTVPAKYVKFKIHQAVSWGLWMIEFEGYTRSDVAIDGWVTLSSPGGTMKSWSVELNFTDVMKGKVEEQFDFGAHEDLSKPFGDVAKRLKQWVEM
jgi:hypothetical protein